MGILDTLFGWIPTGATLGSDGDIYGTGGDDYLVGTDTGEYMSGGDGNDTLRGMGGADRIYGGNGNDLIEGGSGNDTIDGGDGIDTASYFNSTHGVIVNLEFGTAKTLGAGPEDTDTLYSIENVTGSFYDDYLQGTDAANVIDGVAGADVLNGWGGDDTLIGGFGNDLIVGGDGNDRLSGGFDNDQMYGGAGTDTADYSYAYEGMYVSLAEGVAHVRSYASSTIDNDTLTDIENVKGSIYDDMIEGNAAHNVIDGSGGNDTVSYRHSGNAVGVALYAGYGNMGDAWGDTYYSIENIDGSDNAVGDMLAGDDNANRIDGNGGNDSIYGRGGNDTLLGGQGSDYIEGGEGNDWVNGGEGSNTLDGGNGFDTVDFSPSFGGVGPVGPGVTVDMLAGTVSGLGMDGTTIKNFEVVLATVFDDTVLGDASANVVFGGLGKDSLSGRGGNDSLVGGDGSDILNGGTGADILIGQAGADMLTGGTGNDIFTFVNLSDSGVTASTRDQITDFQTGDLIDLSQIDANAWVFGNQAFSFIGNADFTNVAGQLHAVAGAANTMLEGDVNGDGVADFQIRLSGLPALTAADFML